MAQDDFQQARERYDDAREAMRENHARMEEDLEFSNPACPQQWEKKSVTDRAGRPTLTMDNTNQFIQQVVNDGRRNTPSIQTMPEDSGANALVSQQLNGVLRHIEYASRASTAYDTSLEYSARVGLGWIEVSPKMVDPTKNYQEPRIYSCDDPLAGCLDPDSVEFDGSDAMFGFYETTMSRAAFERRWPKALVTPFQTSQNTDWFDRENVRVAKYWRVVEKKRNTISLKGPDGGSYTVGEEEYWDTAKKTGVKPEPIDQYMSTDRTVKCYMMSGDDFLEETDFPCKWIGLVPVYGHVLKVRGKRYVCGLTRRLRDGQRFHNYQMSSLAETLLSQPKAPFMAPGRAIEGYEEHWKALNDGNPTYVPYNDIDDEGNAIAAPARLAAPQFPLAFANAATLGLNEMQAAVGMFKSNLGQQSNAISGKAKLADKSEGDNATFNFHDNQRRSLEQVGRIALNMFIQLNDTKRPVRILDLQGKKATFIVVDPEMDSAVQQDQNGKILAINPNVGEYGVIVKTGPSYATQREELEERLTQISQGNPQLGAALAPLLVQMADLPEAEKVSRICLALLPPNVQQAYGDGGEDNIPPQVKSQMMSQQQQLQQATEMIQKLSAELHAASDTNDIAKDKNDIDAQKNKDAAEAKNREIDLAWYEAKTARIAADSAAAKVTPEAVQEINAIIESHPMVQALAQAVPQLHDQMRGRLDALTDAHAGLHDQLSPPDQPEQEQAAPVMTE